MVHQLGQKASRDLNYSVLLLFTLLSAINQTRAIILVRTIDFHKKLVGWKGNKYNKLHKDKANYHVKNMKIYIGPN